MFIARYATQTGKPETGLFYSPEECQEANPEIIVNFSATSKEEAREAGIALTKTYADMILSWSDLAAVGEWLTEAAEKYGLMEEFKENGLI